MPDITLKTAQEVIRLNEGLKYCRERLKELETAETVVIVVNFVRGKNCYGGKDIAQQRTEVACSSSTLARSTVAGIRQHWERRRDEYIRQLSQIGAEVDHA